MGAARGTTTTPYGDEQRLLEALRAGDDDAFAYLVRAYGPRLLALARTIVRHEADAEDVLQEAFFSAFRGLASFAGGARLATWLHRITVNAGLMKLRARRCRELPQPCHRREEDLRSAAAPDRPVLDGVVCRELEALVRAKIASMAEPHRTILRLRDLEQRSTDETARLLGCSRQAVKTRLHRARRALRAALARPPRVRARTA